MQMKTAALTLAVAAAGIVSSQAFAQDRETIQRETPNGVVTRHIVRDGNGNVRRVVVRRPDGTVIRRNVGYGYGYGHRWDNDHYRMHRTVVIHHRTVPMQHVVVRDVRHHHRPDYVVNRHVTVIHRAG